MSPALESAERMQAFDSLPQPLRRAIADGRFTYDPQEFIDRLAKGRRAETILRGISRYEQRAAQ